MPVYPFDTRPKTVQTPGGDTFDWTPTGRPIQIGDARKMQRNYCIAGLKRLGRFVKEAAPDIASGKLWVGLSHKQLPTWTIDDVIKETRKYLRWRKMDPGSSFIAQRGLWRGEAINKRRPTVDEESVMILIVNYANKPYATFSRYMGELADWLRESLGQEVVYGEVSVGGIPKEVIKAEK